MESRDELLARVMEEAETSGWWTAGLTAAVAVSGGPDSMALLHLLRDMSRERPLRLVALHVNHGFRGAESDAEAALVRRTADAWGIALQTAVIDVPAYIEETGLNAQEAARVKRYEFLLEAAAAHGASALLLGHHADDQAETVLMRVLRGTGVGGLAGIPYRRREGNVELIRPLLRITKEELLAYCKRREVPYAMDSSNASRRYFRNALRLDVMPMLTAYNPRLRESLVRLAALSAADDDYLTSQAEGCLAQVAARRDGGFRLDRRRFAGLHVALQRRLIKLILRYSSDPWHPLPFLRIEALLDAIRDEAKTVVREDVAGGWVLLREYDEVYIGPQPSPRPLTPIAVTAYPFRAVLPETGNALRFERLEGAVTSLPDHRREAFFDEARLSMPLTVRSRMPGDRMAPLGLNGTKKVQDMFVDAKVPRSRREGWPLLADAEGRILWIPGVRRSTHALVTGDTRSTIRVVWDPIEP